MFTRLYIGQLDETAMFYMQQRGIPQKKSQSFIDVRILEYCYQHQNTGIKTKLLKLSPTN
jgi:Fe-S cluster assembly scaffold protein SufB